MRTRALMTVVVSLIVYENVNTGLVHPKLSQAINHQKNIQRHPHERFPSSPITCGHNDVLPPTQSLHHQVDVLQPAQSLYHQVS
mmetsp:Transcript_16811/g.34049  ORF Transcript_16811/g.34049 Transcript_16811/m.34049 type:complete len:84 (-) Transcript_16811:240-491(-)